MDTRWTTPKGKITGRKTAVSSRLKDARMDAGILRKMTAGGIRENRGIPDDPGSLWKKEQGRKTTVFSRLKRVQGKSLTKNKLLNRPGRTVPLPDCSIMTEHVSTGTGGDGGRRGYRRGILET